MKKELQRHKRNDTIKWIAIFLAVLLLAVAITAAITKGFSDWNPYGWFDKACEHEYIDGVCSHCGEEEQTEPNENGSSMIITPNINANAAISLSAVRLGDIMSPQEISTYASEQGSTTNLAENVKRITATVLPVDATDKVLDWTIAWQNSSSTWAIGKTVTDYVTITPTSDGAETADVTCKQAFAEKIIIKASLRGSYDLESNECVVDYTKKVIGAYPRLYNAQPSNSRYYIDWTTSLDNLTPTFDFYRGEASIQGFILSNYASNTAVGNGKLTYDFKYSDTYTLDDIDMQPLILGSSYQIQPTEDYLAVMRTAGMNVKADAGNYITFVSGENSKFSFADILLLNYVNNPLSDNAFVLFKTALKNNASKVMLRLKIVTPEMGDVPATETIYNIKFSVSSLQVTANSLSLPDNIKF